ncbi:hypothetical protein CLTHE_24510 [Clostridium thermobutyricum DSM 4928]|uniref:Uncharacterized protein n=1 Tax=Clostridium thermobutyricum DSM 4928 TaxID=1121339 RepID=A0A1V4SSL1_9CLOT|nr:hypothetical protein CLTHE_24510 [Clostridium thermobutyricum DSM 4928]
MILDIRKIFRIVKKGVLLDNLFLFLSEMHIIVNLFIIKSKVNIKYYLLGKEVVYEKGNLYRGSFNRFYINR